MSNNALQNVRVAKIQIALRSYVVSSVPLVQNNNLTILQNLFGKQSRLRSGCAGAQPDRCRLCLHK